MRREPGGVLFWVGVVAGGAVVAYGVLGALDNLRPVRLANVAVFLGGSALGHDAVWAPAMVAGAMATRWLPAAVRSTVRVALVMTAALVLFAVPVLASDAHDTNPSALPLDYGRNLRAVVGVVWAGTVAIAARQLVRARRPE